MLQHSSCCRRRRPSLATRKLPACARVERLLRHCGSHLPAARPSHLITLKPHQRLSGSPSSHPLYLSRALVRAGACSAAARASEISDGAGWPARLCHHLLPLTHPPFVLPPSCSSLLSPRGSANTRAHTAGNGFASCEIHTIWQTLLLSRPAS